MTNKEKAIEISNACLNCGKTECTIIWCSKKDKNESALKMAKWKDEQFESLLPQLMICAQQGYTQCASDETTLKEMKKILKDGTTV